MGKQESKLKPQAITDLQNTTNFSADEIKQWYKNFVKECPNGHLTIQQFKQVYARHFPGGDATKFAEHVFRTFDKDESKTIDFREFMCAMNVTSRGAPDEKLKWAFEMYDLDGNGRITREETKEIILAIYKMTGDVSVENMDNISDEGTDKIFDHMDINRDGVITMDEFVEGVKSNPSIVKLLTKE